MAEIQLKHVRKTYPGNVQVIPDLNLEIRDKEFVVFVGPSGCGKSTTLRMIAGLEEITDGELYIGGRLVNQVLPKDRDIAMVFQNYALYPHMTVYRNMAFGLQLRKTPKEEIDRKVREAARILDLEKYLERKPKALSGGQRQRVALGRAMVRNPSVFLLDEPLSNLDAKLRTAMRSEIIKLHKRLQTTFIYVTHDQVEAMTMGDRICVLRDGVVQQFDTPQRLFERPANLFVAGFIGSPQMNLVEGVLEHVDSAWWFVAPGLRMEIPASVSGQWQAERLKDQLPVVLGIRPEDLDLATAEEQPDLVVSCELSEMMGSERYLYLKRAEEPDSRNWIARISSREPWNEDSQVRLRVNRERLYCFERETGRNLLPEGQEAPQSQM